MSARYISRRYGETSIARQRAASQSQEREVASTPGTSRRYSRARTSSPVREQSYTNQYTSTAQYYRPADMEVRLTTLSLLSHPLLPVHTREGLAL